MRGLNRALCLSLTLALWLNAGPAYSYGVPALTQTATHLTGISTLQESDRARLGYRDGLYLDLGLGYAAGLGERGVALKGGSCNGYFLWEQPGTQVCIPTGVPGQASYDEVVRTSAGSQLGLQLILGYNILGHVSIEAAIGGAGTPSPLGGSVHIGGQLRYHPVEPALPLSMRDWDVNVMVGFGYSLMGYTPEHDPDSHLALSKDVDDAFESKGWEGLHVSFGAGFQYRVSESVSVGFDLKVVRPLYDQWVANFEAPYKTRTESTPEAWVIMPTAQVKFHLWSPGRAPTQS